ncbi:Conserved hypothetical membrane protein [Zobellia galactanivorans]|uniref:Conserved hypothetical membrane protein n=2 Tax=Flavobacteriaceae TaxID=49546 RepID=G0L544_ZOBGA|nr:Conserved hypothetical membrane protein [Zobellia galactanivorans]
MLSKVAGNIKKHTMNKTFTLILIALAVALIAYNVTIVDFQDPLNGDSTIALIGIVASLCAVLLLLIFRTSKKIQKKIEQRD